MGNSIKIIISIIFLINFAKSQEIISFDSEKWDLLEAKKTEYLGKKSIMGNAYLKDMKLKNGIIEFDMAVTGERSYPGVLFRMKDRENYERFYIRPHLPKIFKNVLQYVPAYNGIDSWQLYNGPGITASGVIPVKEWFHIKLEIKNNQAKVYLGNMQEPALYIKELSYPTSEGGIGLMGPADGSAYFANFSCREDENLIFPDEPKKELPFGMITEWEISNAYKLNEIDPEQLPEKQKIKDFKWQKIKALPNGIVDISRYYPRSGNIPDIIWAKTIIKSEKEQIGKYDFGYSDIIYIFLNGKLCFAGNSAYMSRDPNFQGIIGLNDQIHLPLKKGNNELLIALVESFGGWGFMFRNGNAIYMDKSIKKEWEIANNLNYPESAVYDKKRDKIYVSNMQNNGKEYISKINLKGEIEKIDWVQGIFQPTGLCISNDKLYAVGRYNLLEIDIDSGKIVKRYPFPSPGFPNDVTNDEEWNLYVTDSRKGCVYKLNNGKFEEWIKGIGGANGILIDKDKMLIGATSDASIKIIDLKTREIKTHITLSDGSIMDGLRCDGKGNYLISDYRGQIFKVSPDGKSTLLIDTRATGKTTADFEFIPEKKLFIIPTLEDNRIMMFRMEEK